MQSLKRENVEEAGLKSRRSEPRKSLQRFKNKVNKNEETESDDENEETSDENDKVHQQQQQQQQQYEIYYDGNIKKSSVKGNKDGNTVITLYNHGGKVLSGASGGGASGDGLTDQYQEEEEEEEDNQDESEGDKDKNENNNEENDFVYFDDNERNDDTRISQTNKKSQILKQQRPSLIPEIKNDHKIELGYLGGDTDHETTAAVGGGGDGGDGGDSVGGNLKKKKNRKKIKYKNNNNNKNKKNQKNERYNITIGNFKFICVL